MAAASATPASGPSSVFHSALFTAPGRPRPLARRLAIHNRVVRRIRRFLEEDRFQEIAVPALTPDTRAAKTPRELLAAHTAEANCAVCHRQIDPLGFVLEPYDPVGRWRTTWPGSDTPIDATATLPPAPYPHPGLDMTEDNLDCASKRRERPQRWVSPLEEEGTEQ